MDTPKICPEFVYSCIRQFKSILTQRKKPLRYVEVGLEDEFPSLYDMAKENETKTRNLRKALSLYAKAALNGEKVNSCIKDFASVLHQGGYTLEAIRFLEEMRAIYKGDLQKYQKLIMNLSSQLRPTGKHEYKNILIDLVDIKLEEGEKQILEMFGNSSRIKNMSFYQNLGFKAKVGVGRFAVIQFDSFSAAKKTMETFKQEQWFGVNKYWLDTELCVIAESCDAKTDFEKGILLSKGKISKINGKCIDDISSQIVQDLNRFQKFIGAEGLELTNEISIHLIQNWKNYFMKQDALEYGQ